MGKPKLLLPFGASTVIGNLLQALSRSEIASINVVCREGDTALRDEVRSHGGRVLIPPVDSPDMRSSVEFGLESIAASDDPVAEDGWILIPADHPLVTPGTLDRLFEFWVAESPTILVPTFQGKRGHPTLFRWETASLVPRIPPNRGINWLLRESGLPVAELKVGDPLVVEDLDTPEDYERLRNASAPPGPA